MLDRRLVRAINRGRCFALVGSGPSSEIGYPSWHKLAEETYKALVENGVDTDTASYETYLKERKYPELFRQAEVDIGGRDALVNLLKDLLRPSARNRGHLYETLSNWPFACYLTTNYDDELFQYLSNVGVHFTVHRNRREDFYPMRDGASHLIQKLHSDLDHPNEVVITSTDYRRLYLDSEGQYFTDKLRQVLEMFDVFIIGHSLSDPDLDHILQLARRTASPEHPIYMIGTGFTRADEREYLEKYNIVLVQYSNEDGTHRELRRLLATAGRFIVPRQHRRERDGVIDRPVEEVESAVALFLYRRLRQAPATESMSPLLLSGLERKGMDGFSLDELFGLPGLQALANKGSMFNEAAVTTLRKLVTDGLVSVTSERYSITELGRSQVDESRAVRNTERDQAYGQFGVVLKAACDSATVEEVEQCQSLAERALVASFASRGLTIANKVFTGHTANPEELSDIFGVVSEVAVEIKRMDVRAAFVEAMHRFLVEPNAPQRNYIASISQGYFLYHLLGMDPRCSQLRRDIFRRTLWLCDSSVLLPWTAIGCSNHEYASELFRMLAQAEATLYTTPKLLRETWEHFKWAVSFVRRHGVDSSEFLHAALNKGSFKQNLFLDGYVRWSAEGKVGPFAEYLDLVCPKGIDRSSFEARIVNAGVRIITPSDVDGYETEDLEDIRDAKAKVKTERLSNGTYRSELQIESEGEIWVLVKHLRTGKYTLPDFAGRLEKVYFLSLSRMLDRVFQPEAVATWTPEAVYRYMAALPESQMNPDLLQQCMLHEYYYAGISFIDRDRYLRFFGPSVDAAKASFEQERSKYIAEMEGEHARDLDEAFERTPDLEKPFFVAQMGWRVAERAQQLEDAAKKRAAEAEALVKQLKSEKDRAWKTREKNRQEQEAATLRNLQDPKHVRKRLKQAKKRKRKQK